MVDFDSLRYNDMLFYRTDLTLYRVLPIASENINLTYKHSSDILTSFHVFLISALTFCYICILAENMRPYL